MVPVWHPVYNQLRDFSRGAHMKMQRVMVPSVAAVLVLLAGGC